MLPEEIVSRIEKSFTEAQAEARDLTGTGDHFEAIIVTPEFDGLRTIQRHQKVYDIFRDELAAGTLHAFTLKTLTPSEAEDKIREEEHSERRYPGTHS